MNLDDLQRFKELDTLDMLGEIEGLPDQLQSAWQLGQTMPLPDVNNIRAVVISGMGGSAIGADLLAAAVAIKLPRTRDRAPGLRPAGFCPRQGDSVDRFLPFR